MHLSIPSILLAVGVKCLLNWGLVLLQRNHICRSFVGVFSISVSIADTALTLAVAALHLQGDGLFLGLRLTRHHVCLLVQILGQIYGALQWPVVVVAGLDHYCTVSQRSQLVPARFRKIIRSFVTSLLWNLALLYVFLLSDFLPILEEESPYLLQRCWVFHMPQILQVAMALLLTAGCVVLHAGWPPLSCCGPRFSKHPPPKDQTIDQSETRSRREIVHQASWIFLNTWALFLFFLAAFLLLPVGIPAYLGLNVPWLCFLNSLLIGVVLCAICPASQLAKGSAAVPPDSFCDWRFS
uniref:probable G-protein coupled receptor 160 n=1 Tax=Centroberyx gerrardi TaxID=166262 RepID=UPI003AABA1A2